jgi:HSP20 family protein
MSSRDLTRYSGSRGGVMPLSEAMSQLFRDAFTSPFGAGVTTMTIGQAVNLYEQDNNYIMQVPLPGIKQDQLNITARENVVTLQGTVEIPAPQGARSLFQGIGGGQFREQVVLPSDIDAENASAQYQDGILTLSLPKAQHARERTIPIMAGSGQQQARLQQQGQMQQQGQQTSAQQAQQTSAQQRS